MILISVKIISSNVFLPLQHFSNITGKRIEDETLCTITAMIMTFLRFPYPALKHHHQVSNNFDNFVLSNLKSTKTIINSFETITT